MLSPRVSPPSARCLVVSGITPAPPTSPCPTAHTGTAGAPRGARGCIILMSQAVCPGMRGHPLTARIVLLFCRSHSSSLCGLRPDQAQQHQWDLPLLPYAGGLVALSKTSRRRCLSMDRSPQNHRLLRATAEQSAFLCSECTGAQPEKAV